MLTWKDNIKMELKKCEIVNWIQAAQNSCHWRALVNVVVNLRVP
jgi:hypothetical protein